MKKTDCENSILNSCLEEIFQDAAPPDLSQEILREWAKREASNGQQIESDAETTLPVQAPETAVDELNRLTRPAVIVDASERSSANQRKDSLPDCDNHLARNVKPRPHFGSWLVAASILVAVTAGTVWFWNTPEGHLAGKFEHPQGKTKDAGAKDLSVPSPNETGRPANPHTDQPSSGSPRVADTQPAASAFEDDPPFGEKSPAHLDPASAPRSKALVERLADAEVVERVDQLLQDSWADHSVIPSPTATDSEWCRRVYLRLIGRIPTVQELQRFADDESPERRSRLVDELLEASPYSEEYVRNWSLLWTNFLIGRQGGTQPNDKGNRDGLESYLRDACRDTRTPPTPPAIHCNCSGSPQRTRRVRCPQCARR